MDQRTSKSMTMHNASHPGDNITRQYASRKEEKRVLARTDDCVDASMQKLEKYINRAKKDFIKKT